jgi:hypothetical protein
MMPEVDKRFERFARYMKRHGYFRFEPGEKFVDVTYYTAKQAIMTNREPRLEIAFDSDEHFSLFVEDIVSLDSRHEEMYLRNTRPELRRAYEEYKILLELYR